MAQSRYLLGLCTVLLHLDREKAFPSAPEPIIHMASEPPIYLSLCRPPDFGDAHVRSMQREAACLAAKAEECVVQEEEAVQQSRIKKQHAVEVRQEEEEELARRAQLECDLVRKAFARAAREQAEWKEEEQCVCKREERRQQSAERKAEEMRRVEEWMCEEERKCEEFARTKHELKKNMNECWEAACVAAVKRRRESRLDGDGVLLSGWVTVQNSESVAWQRRYFQLSDALFKFYHQQSLFLAPWIESREASSECQWEVSIRLGHLVLCNVRESALHVPGAGATMQAPSAVGQNLWVQPREVSCAGG